MAKGLIAVIIILFVLVFFNAVAGKSLFKGLPAPPDPSLGAAAAVGAVNGAAVAGATDPKIKGGGA